MGDDLLAEMGRKILEDLVRSSLTGALPTESELKSRRGRLSKSALPLGNDDMDARLRSIRRYITPRELAALLHWHPETVYRKIKSGMPADRDVDDQGNGRRLKIYPPEIADWLRDCHDAQRSLMQSSSGPQVLMRDREGLRKRKSRG